MIGRVWHGWTTHANADAFEAVIRNEVWPSLLARKTPGFKDMQFLRLVRAGHTEFASLIRFEDLDAVRQFAGDDYAKVVLPAKARGLLRRFDTRADHYEIRDFRTL